MKAIQMPPTDEIIKRLMAINNHNDDHDRRLYRLIASKLTNEKNGYGVVISIQLAIYDYMAEGDYPPIMAHLLNACIPDYIDALIDDAEVKADAMDIIQQGG